MMNVSVLIFSPETLVKEPPSLQCTLRELLGFSVEVAMLSMNLDSYISSFLFCMSSFLFLAMLHWQVPAVLSRMEEMRKDILTFF